MADENTSHASGPRAGVTIPHASGSRAKDNIPHSFGPRIGKHATHLRAARCGEHATYCRHTTAFGPRDLDSLPRVPSAHAQRRTCQTCHTPSSHAPGNNIPHAFRPRARVNILRAARQGDDAIRLRAKGWTQSMPRAFWPHVGENEPSAFGSCAGENIPHAFGSRAEKKHTTRIRSTRRGLRAARREEHIPHVFGPRAGKRTTRLRVTQWG